MDAEHRQLTAGWWRGEQRKGAPDRVPRPGLLQARVVLLATVPQLGHGERDVVGAAGDQVQAAPVLGERAEPLPQDRRELVAAPRAGDERGGVAEDHDRTLAAASIP